MFDISTKSGKYRIVQDDTGNMTIYRNEEVWIEGIQGAKMIIELCIELEELRRKEK